MRPSDAEEASRFHELGELLWPRKGWSLEPSPTPGGPESWCHEHHGRVTASVGIDAAGIWLYLARSDEELRLGSIDELRAWLDANPEAGA